MPPPSCFTSTIENLSLIKIDCQPKMKFMCVKMTDEDDGPDWQNIAIAATLAEEIAEEKKGAIGWKKRLKKGGQ
jgi:hypothetical protein